MRPPNSFKLPDLERCPCGRSFDGSGRHFVCGKGPLCDTCTGDDLQQLNLWPVGVGSGLAPADAKKKRRRR